MTFKDFIINLFMSNPEQCDLLYFHETGKMYRYEFGAEIECCISDFHYKAYEAVCAVLDYRSSDTDK